jgi:hypothetical protein
MIAPHKPFVSRPKQNNNDWRLVAKRRRDKITDLLARARRLRKALSAHVGGPRAAKVERGES